MKWAYHLTTEGALPSIKQHGLRPSVTGVTRRGEPLVFFAHDPEGAMRYAVDRQDPVLLRFPMPQDCEGEDDDCTSRAVVPTQAIEVYVGNAVERLSPFYALHDEEERYARFYARLAHAAQRVRRSPSWVALTAHVP